MSIEGDLRVTLRVGSSAGFQAEGSQRSSGRIPVAKASTATQRTCRCRAAEEERIFRMQPRATKLPLLDAYWNTWFLTLPSPKKISAKTVLLGLVARGEVAPQADALVRNISGSSSVWVTDACKLPVRNVPKLGLESNGC